MRTPSSAWSIRAPRNSASLSRLMKYAGGSGVAATSLSPSSVVMFAAAAARSARPAVGGCSALGCILSASARGAAAAAAAARSETHMAVRGASL